MFELYLQYLFLSAFFIQTFGRAVVIGTASWFDVAHGHKSTPRLPVKLPKITVVVLASNNEATLQDCLKSLTNNAYNNTEIIVVDNASTDGTKLVARTFLDKHPDLNLRIIAKRKQDTNKRAYFSAAKYIHGDFLLTLKGDEKLADGALELIAARTSMYQQHAIQLNRQIEDYPSLFVLMDRFNHLLYSQTSKAMSMASYQNVSLNSSCEVYAYNVFKRFTRNNTTQVWLKSNIQSDNYYASDVIVYKAPDSSMSNYINARLQKDYPMYAHDLPSYAYAAYMYLLRIGSTMKLLEPFVFSYFFYVAYTGKNSSVFYACVLVTIAWLTSSVLSAKHASLIEKLKLLLLIPATYVLYLLQLYISTVRWLYDTFLALLISIISGCRHQYRKLVHAATTRGGVQQH